MDISLGYTIEKPKIEITWGITKNKFHSLLDGQGLEVNMFRLRRYITCVSLGGLYAEVAFGFGERPRGLGGCLNLVTIHSGIGKDLIDTIQELTDIFNLHQTHLQ